MAEDLGRNDASGQGSAGPDPPKLRVLLGTVSCPEAKRRFELRANSVGRLAFLPAEAQESVSSLALVEADDLHRSVEEEERRSDRAHDRAPGHDGGWTR